MALLARLKKDFKYPRAVLFSGHEIVKSEWRRVPAGFEAQAEQDERVETKRDKSEPVSEPEGVIARPDEGRRGSTRKKTMLDGKNDTDTDGGEEAG